MLCKDQKKLKGFLGVGWERRTWNPHDRQENTERLAHLLEPLVSLNAYPQCPKLKWVARTPLCKAIKMSDVLIKRQHVVDILAVWCCTGMN